MPENADADDEHAVHDDAQADDGRRFAFGYDTVDAVCCPARAAGYSPSDGDESTTIAEMYDTTAREHEQEYDGTLSEDEAEAVWKETVEHAARLLERGEGSVTGRDVQVGREIADELGWEVPAV